MNTKDRIIEAASKLILFKGYNNTGLKEILEQADVPKGSFYHYFKSKEDLALELLNTYRFMAISVLDKCIEDNKDNPLKSIVCFFQTFHNMFEEYECRGGCAIGNLGQELSDTEETIRLRTQEVFLEITSKISAQFKKAQEMGLFDIKINTEEYGNFVFNSWEGALLMAKVRKSKQPLELFLKYTLSF